MSKSLKHILLLNQDFAEADRIIKKLNKASFQFEIHQIKNRDEYLEIIANIPPDIIITDNDVTDIDGFEVIKIARNHYPETPVIIFTEKLGDELAVEFMRSGATDFILKTNISHLLPAVEREISRLQVRKVQQQSENNFISQSKEIADEKTKYQDLTLELTKSLNSTIELNRQLEAAKIKAEESDNLKTSFLHNISHEIRTPLNAIVGFSNLLLRTDDKERQTEYNSIIQSSAQQLLNIIDDIVEVSQVETKQVEIKWKPTKLNQVIDELYNTFSPKNIRNIEFQSVKNFPDEYSLECDPERLKQIFRNLLNNAFKFTIKGNIHFGYSMQNDSLVFFVRDTGIGIPKSKQSIIFEHFRQSDATIASTFGGTGIGLSISKGIVEAMAGEIWVDSVVGQGTTFSFTISPPSTKYNRRLDVKVLKDNDFQGIKVLIVEDDLNNYYLLEAILTEWNCKTIYAENGIKAIEQCQNNEIDLILMDIKMPLMGGKEAFLEIRKRGYTMPIIAQTAFSLIIDEEIILNMGFDDYIPKPISEIVLLLKMRNIFVS